MGGNYIYRGEPKRYSKVSSTLYRALSSAFGEIEDQHFHVELIQREMLQAAKQFVGDMEEADILAQLQHYGHITNLIDFTTDYHVALFFACDGQPQEDGRLILLQKADYSLIEPNSPANRIIAQKSIFVQPPEGFVEPGDIVVIPRELKEPILEYLSKCHGIGVATIYNDLHGFMRYHAVHQSAYAEFYAGQTHLLRREHQRAIERYEKAIQLNPQMDMAYNNRGAAWMAQGDYHRAVGDFDRAIRLNPQDAGAHNNRGVAYKERGEYDLAIQDYDKAIELDPGFAGAFDNRGNIYKIKGDYDRAIEEHGKAIELGSNSFEPFANRAVAHYLKGDHDLAIKDYSVALQLGPGSAVLHTNRGWVYFSAGDHTHALQDFDSAISLDNRLALAYYNRGVTRLAMADWAEARPDLSTARDLGYDIPATFLDDSGGIDAFEHRYGVQLPHDIVTTLTHRQQ